MRIHIYLIFLTLGLLTSCDVETSKLAPKPKAMGKMNEIVVVCDDDIWEGPVGDSIRYYYESAYPLMPAPEPLFDLRHFTTRDLGNQPMRKELRTYFIVANLRDTTSQTTKMVIKDMGPEKYRQFLENNRTRNSVGKDKWANGQVLFYVLGNDVLSLSANIKNSFKTIAAKVRKHDLDQLDASIYAIKGTNKGISNVINDRFGLDMRIPQRFVTVIDDKETGLIWLRNDMDKAIQNIVIFDEEYTHEPQLEKEYIVEKINTFGKNYVTSTNSDSYLVVNEDHLPIISLASEMGGVFTQEHRGIWEMTNDFYGGPFFLYASVKEKKVRYILCFILAPNSDKRDFMMQLDHIVKNPSF